MPNETVLSKSADTSAGGTDAGASAKTDHQNAAQTDAGKAAVPSDGQTNGKESAVNTASSATADKAAIAGLEKYELKIAEGSLLDASAVETVSALAKELKLGSNEDAQKVLDYGNAVAAKLFESQKAQHEAAKVKWIEDVHADPEIGGANFDRNAENAKRFVAKFGSDKIKQIFDETGYGNHPELVRMLAKAGALFREDSQHFGSAPTSTKPKTFAEAMYPDKPKA